MLSRKTIEAYLFFLLRHKVLVSAVIAVMTVGLALSTYFWMHVRPDFASLYPPKHPYIQLYNAYRNMFGTAFTVQIVVEARRGTIFDSPDIVQKVDRITLELLHDVPGVNGEQVISITHPKLKTTMTAGSGIKVVPLMYPRIPENAEDLAFLKQKVYTTEGVRGFFVSEDDKATQIVAGFWEEYFDVETMWKKLQAMKEREQDDNTIIYVTGMPVLFGYFLFLAVFVVWGTLGDELAVLDQVRSDTGSKGLVVDTVEMSSRQASAFLKRAADRGQWLSGRMYDAAILADIRGS